MLGFNGVDYTLQTINSKGSEDFEPQEILCCVSENFLKEDENLVTFVCTYRGKLCGKLQSRQADTIRKRRVSDSSNV